MINENEYSNENKKIRQENELKKLKLSAEFGAKFYESNETDLPPDIDSQFLNQIQQFEEAAARKESKKIKEILGNPVFKAEKSLPDAQVKEELSKILEFMNLNQINLDVMYKVDDREIYRFITEELIEEELSVFGLPGMTSCFIYEEFYPNHEEDVKKYSVDFLESLFNKKFEFMHYNISQEMQLNGEKTSAEEFVVNAQSLMEKAGEIILPSIEVESVTFRNDKAEVECVILFQKLHQNAENMKKELNATIHFHKQYEYWYLNQVVLPMLGFN